MSVVDGRGTALVAFGAGPGAVVAKRRGAVVLVLVVPLLGAHTILGADEVIAGTARGSAPVWVDSARRGSVAEPPRPAIEAVIAGPGLAMTASPAALAVAARIGAAGRTARGGSA